MQYENQASVRVVVQPQSKKIVSQIQQGTQTQMQQFFAKNNLVDLSFNISDLQMKSALSTLNFLPELLSGDEELAAAIPEAMRDHIKTAMFITMKCIQMKEASFQDCFIKEPETLLRNLTNLLRIKGDFELDCNSLKQILTLLEKYEKQFKALPVVAIRHSGLVSLLGDRIRVTLNSNKYDLEIARLSISVMIQISYLNPNEFNSAYIEQVMKVCGLQSQYDSVSVNNPSFTSEQKQILIKIQEQAIKLICNLVTNPVSCANVINPEKDSIFGIFNCLRSPNKNTVKFGLGCLLNYS